jgi:signal transduction histidine kinase
LLTLVVARGTSDIDKTLASLRMILTGVGVTATFLALLVLATIIRRGLRPVDSMAAQIQGVGEDDLSVRIRLDAVPRELRPIGTRLNELLGRLEEAFEREKSFSADVSHELRTPLAGLRTTLEVALAGKADPDTYAEALADSLTICHQTQSMVENLLCLARIDAGQSDVELQPVDIGALLRECWESLADRAKSRDLKMEWRLPEGLSLATDRENLRIIFTGLLDNAVSHADAGGNITLEGASRNGHIEVTVRNSGSRLSREEAQNAFRRFWRGDASRQSTGVHCGLGLSLCSKLAELLNGSLSVTSERGGEFAACLRLEEGQE